MSIDVLGWLHTIDLCLIFHRRSRASSKRIVSTYCRIMKRLKPSSAWNVWLGLSLCFTSVFLIIKLFAQDVMASQFLCVITRPTRIVYCQNPWTMESMRNVYIRGKNSSDIIMVEGGKKDKFRGSVRSLRERIKWVKEHVRVLDYTVVC